MRNRLLFIVGFVISFGFSLATLNFVINFNPASNMIHVVLNLPAKDVPHITQTVYTTKDLDCLQQNIFFEARNQESIGMTMIGVVTVQRTKLPEYPDTICGVVYQRWQFSWTAKKHKVNMKNPVEAQAWQQCRVVAENVLKNANRLDSVYNGVIFYHTKSVHPKWANKMQREFVLKDHIFYSKAKNETSSFVLR